MSGLPEGWVWATLEEVLACETRAITDGPFGSNLKSAHYTDSGARVIRLQNVGDGVFRDERAYISLEHFETLRAHEAREGDLLLASLGEKLPRAALMPKLEDPAIVKADVIRARPHPEISAKWLLYALQAPQAQSYAGGLIKGVGRPRLGMAAMRKIPVPVPPLAEQHRIVEALEEQLSRLDAAERVLRVNHARIRALAARVTNFATARAVPADQPTARLPREADAIDRNLPRIPSSWSWERLGDIAEVVGGVTKDKKKQLDSDLTEVPYLRVANVQRGWLDLSRVATIRVLEKKAEDLRLETGDVLMNEGGDRDKLGRGWVWRGEVKDAIHQNHVFRARVHGEVILPELLAYHANSSARWFEANGKQTTNLASISLKKIRNLPVPIPPAGEQPEILQQSGEQLDGLARVGAAVEVGLKRAVTLRSALLRKAMTGDLTPQDPADEPAATLLARIAAEREAATPVRKAAKRAARPRKAIAAAAAVTKAAPAPTTAPSTSVQQELFDQ